MAVETECCDNGKVSAIAVSGNSNIINLCCNDGSSTGTGTADDPYQDDTPMTSDDSQLEDGWVGDSLFQAKCCANESVQLRWTVEGAVTLYRDGIQIYTGTDTEFVDVFVLTEPATYRLTGVNGVDKQITLSPTDCVACNPFTLRISCGTGDGELVGELIGVTGVEYVVFERDSTIVAEGLISGFNDTPGDGTFEYIAYVDGVPVTAPSVTMPDECELEWSEWECVPSVGPVRPPGASINRNAAYAGLPYSTEFEFESSDYATIGKNASVYHLGSDGETTGTIQGTRVWDGTRRNVLDGWGVLVVNDYGESLFTVCYRYRIIP